MSYSSLSAEELVRACSESGNAEAWEEFVRRFGPVINKAIWRIVLRHGEYDPALIEDLSQDTFVKLCADDFRVLRKFKSQHENAFYGMAGKVAANVARDHYRPARPPISDCDLSDLEDFLADPHASGPGQIERRILFQEIDCILCAFCSARDREIFWLYYGENGLTAGEIARIDRFNLDESGVESVIHRLKCLVRRKIAEQNENGNQGPDKAA
jgi:RNA polymerase sigma-70 factor (ECF subfamily)